MYVRSSAYLHDLIFSMSISPMGFSPIRLTAKGTRSLGVSPSNRRPGAPGRVGHSNRKNHDFKGIALEPPGVNPLNFNNKLTIS